MSPNVPAMKTLAHNPPLAWLTVLLAEAVLPALAMLLLRDTPAPAPLALMGGPILAVGLMGMGMIAAAAAGRLWIGLGLGNRTRCQGVVCWTGQAIWLRWQTIWVGRSFMSSACHVGDPMCWRRVMRCLIEC
jgi:hypothetical protein